jgi:acetyltransferase-like isoleucine patch superfamily enzyme
MFSKKTEREQWDETVPRTKLAHELYRFLGMYAPFEALRIAMYRKAGIQIGNIFELGGQVWMNINYKNMIVIQDDVIIGGHSKILSQSFLLFGHKKEGIRQVIIKKGARIGFQVIILPGVVIGENSIIGAGSVVTRSIPPNCVAVGVPAKPIRYLKTK